MKIFFVVYDLLSFAPLIFIHTTLVIYIFLDYSIFHEDRVFFFPLELQDENGDIVLDEDREPLIHTDGTGFISEDLALKTPKDFTRAKYIKDEKFEVMFCTCFLIIY